MAKEPIIDEILRREILSDFPYKVEWKNGTLQEVFAWCRDESGRRVSRSIPRYRAGAYSSPYTQYAYVPTGTWDYDRQMFYFKDLVHATHFKLRWG